MPRRVVLFLVAFLGVAADGFVAERWNPYATLTAVTALWGSQHSVIKLAETAGASSDAATAARFCVAAACLSPWLPRDRSTWRAGLELGAYSFCGFAAQAVGLETTTATKSAFLLYLNVKLVPIVGVLAGRPPKPSVWLWAGIALAGTTSLAADGGLDNFVVGDAWCLLAAAASAVFIFRLEDLSQNVAGSAAQLTSATASTTAALALAWTAANDDLAFYDPTTLLERGGGGSLSATLASALYLGAVPSALCGYLQTVAQKQVSAYRAAVIYALDPIWAAAFAHLILQENLGGPTGQFGAFLVAFAALAQPLQDLSFFSTSDRAQESVLALPFNATITRQQAPGGDDCGDGGSCEMMMTNNNEDISPSARRRQSENIKKKKENR